ncbi:MAG TPA: S1C family serine protease [Terriglobales bacterium]|nr:S1C family serine protease [Terriglobales bacterium]
MATTLTELSKALADAVEAAGRNVVAVHEGGRAGVSATLWRDDIAVTAAHTIAGLKSVTLTLPDGTSGTAEVAGVLPTADLAVLKLAKKYSSHAQAAAAGALRVGDFVLAVGRRGANGVVATHGIISAIGEGEKPLRLDVQPFTGFSGGPLVGADGRVIGVNTSGPRRNLATIPAAAVESAVVTLLAKGRFPVPYIGIGLQPVRLSSSAQSDAVRRALLVVMVEPSGPAHKAGLLVGDIISHVDGAELTQARDLERALKPERIGQSIRVGVIRAGKQQEIAVTIGDRESR